jgi:LacI family repressor for deo operon, udp, cdd, tsx, nupC, and nupG
MFNVAEGMTSVLADDYGAAKMAVEYFLERGHRRIACLIEDTGDSTQIMRDRFAGYQDALQQAGIDAPPKWGRMVDGSLVLRGRQSHLEWGREQMSAWLNEGFRQLRCTAILAQNDHVAIGIMQILREANIEVPGRISVMGFDGTELCDHATPRLTSMQMPLEQMGFKAVESLVNQIEKGRAEAQILVLPAKLREGDSVASL